MNGLFMKNLTLLLGPASVAFAVLIMFLSPNGDAIAASKTDPERGKPTYTVTGEITFWDNGAPAADIVVVSSAEITATTDDNGIFKLVGLPPGQHILTPTYEDPSIIYEFEPVWQTVVVPSMTVTQYFTIATVIAVDYGIFGQIADSDGIAIMGVDVTLDGRNTTNTDEDGNFRFFPVQPGEHDLLVEKSGYMFEPAKRKAYVPGNLSDQNFVGFTRERVYLPLIRQ